MTSQTPEEQAYSRGYEQGKFDAEMNRLNITPDTTEIEEVVDAITKAIFMDGAKLFPSTREKVTKIIHQELQKARGEAVIWTMRNFETMHKEDWGTKTFGEYMIDRYYSELDQDVSK